jgi:AP-1-like factor
MDAYSDTSFWDNTPPFTQLPDSDFFALLQKQFPPVSNTQPFVAVNPQNLSYSLPSLTPPSDDSSPSPPNFNQEVANDDVNEPHLKRKASSEDLSDSPNQKSQHTCECHHIPEYFIFSCALPQPCIQIRKVIPSKSHLAMP